MIIIQRNGKAVVLSSWGARLAAVLAFILLALFMGLIAFVFLGIAVTLGAVLLILLPVAIVVALVASFLPASGRR